MRSLKGPIVSKSTVIVGAENSQKHPAVQSETTKAPVVGKEVSVASRVAHTMKQECIIGGKENCEETCVIGLVSSETDQEKRRVIHSIRTRGIKNLLWIVSSL